MLVLYITPLRRTREYPEKITELKTLSYNVSSTPSQITRKSFKIPKGQSEAVNQRTNNKVNSKYSQEPTKHYTEDYSNDDIHGSQVHYVVGNKNVCIDVNGNNTQKECIRKKKGGG